MYIKSFEEKDLDSFMTYRNNEEWRKYHIAKIEKENIASKNLLLKLGFVYDGWIDKWQSEIYVYSK